MPELSGKLSKAGDRGRPSLLRVSPLALPAPPLPLTVDSGRLRMSVVEVESTTGRRGTAAGSSGGSGLMDALHTVKTWLLSVMSSPAQSESKRETLTACTLFLEMLGKVGLCCGEAGSPGGDRGMRPTMGTALRDSCRG